ncbi:uncharacterized protein LOC119685514 [Teleopsis dalmanni]|uniref:uncharacterized protein LOC119684557 n=1 Tax=Teleopsis dalmanni TaxID=139649 RepID=UPI0018CDAC13|nr:uncharacterized protein LOC119684557 [Teleopsis dalmanni]XP_037955740.1 uncharacterized protein LOC119685514 [Teleopsis dalmanni]
MIKDTVIVAGLLALCAAAVIYVDAQAQVEGCLYENELWGSEDGTKFYFCLPGTNTAIEQSCAPNTFFVKNDTVSGCIPATSMDPNCVNLEPVGSCVGDNLNQPQPSSDPTKYYLCTSENATPLQLQCPDNKAFVKQDGYLGCFEWSTWRDIRDCPS